MPSSLFFRQSNTTLLDLFPWPLPCGYLGVDRASAWIHLVKYLVATIIMSFFGDVGSMGPTKSMAHCTNGYELFCEWYTLEGRLGTDLYHWHQNE
ncbi:unnamed protein product [Prunus armeniaca]